MGSRTNGREKNEPKAMRPRSPEAGDPHGLASRLEDYIRSTASNDSGEDTRLDAETLRQLKALGYL